MTLFKRLSKPKPPTEAELVRARVQELTSAMKDRRAPGTSRPPLRIVSSESLENELDPKETPPRGSS